MASRDARRVPSSRRAALLLLGPLAVLALLLLGLTSSASAEHGFAAPVVTVSSSVGDGDPAPSWGFDQGTADSAVCTLSGPGGTVVETRSGCLTPFVPTAGSLTGDGEYSLVVTASYDAEYDGAGLLVHEGGSASSAPVAHLYDSTAPVLSVAGPSGAEYTGWTVGVTSGGSAVSLTCTWAGPAPLPASGACSPGTVRPELSTDGAYTLTVSGSDAAGNTAEPVTSAAFTYDGTAPTISFSVQPTGPATNPNPQWVYAVAGGPAPVCTLTGPGTATTTVGCSTTDYTASLSSSGTYTLTVTSTDEAGNVGSATSAGYVLDVTGPTVGISPAGATTGSEAGISWTVSTGDATSATCALSNGTTSTCATGSVISATLATDGTITLTVTALDSLDNESQATASYTRDTTPGTPTVMVTPSRSADPAVTWSFTTGDLTESVQCRVDGPSGPGTPGDCTTFDGTSGTHAVTLVGDGVYTLHVVASNSTSPYSSTGTAGYTLDTSEPDGPTLTQTPSATSGQTAQISWAWTVLDGHTTYCRLSVNGLDGSWATCAGSFSTTATVQGDHTLQVLYRDDLGNEGTISSSTYTYDTSAPAAPAVTLVGEQLRQPGDVTWTWTNPDGAFGTECRVIGPGADAASVGWGSCAMPMALSGDGVHLLEVRHYDAAGNRSDVDSSSVTIDGTAPQAPAVSATGGPTNVSPLTWTLTQPGDGTGFRCRLVVNGDTTQPFTDCASNYSHTPTVQGTYRLDAVSVDAAGNVSAVTQGPTWTYDSVAPDAPEVTLETTSGRTTSATWTVTPLESGTTQQCRLTRTHPGGTQLVVDWTACSSYTFALDAGDGVYVLEVRSSDALGNVSTATTGPGYTLDATPPATPTVTGSRTGTGNATSLTYAFVTEDGGTASCRLLLDGVEVATYADCHLTSPFPVTLSHGDGSYRLEVVVTDSFGNASDPGLSAAYLLDTAPPAAPLVTSGPTARTTDTTLAWTTELAAADGGVALECRLVRTGITPGAFTTCAADYAGLADGTYRLDVRSVDAAGNVSTVTSSNETTVDTTGPADPVVGLTVTSGNTKSATWSVTAAEAGRVECLLTRTAGGTTTTVSGWGVCSAPYTFALLAGDGLYVLHVRTYDDLGNVSAEVAGPGYTLDATAPAAPTVVGSRDGTTSSARDVTYSYSGDGTAICRLLHDGVEVTPAGATCTATTYTATLPSASGTYRLHVTFTDAFGNTGTAGVSGSYVLDVTPPTAPTVKGSRDGQTDNELAVRYAYSGEGTATCRLFHEGLEISPAGAQCTSATYTVTLPSVDGTYWLTVTFTDAYGNTSVPGVSGEYELDVTAPTVPTVTGSRDGQTDNELAVTYTYSGEGTATCRLLHNGTEVSPAGAQCTGTTYTVTLPATDGTYRLEVTFTDAVGNVSVAGVSGSYVLDVTAPTVPTVKGDRDGQTDNELAVTYTYSGEGTATCRLLHNGIEVSPTGAQCTDTTYTATLPATDGAYRLEVTFTDAYGNTSDPGVSGDYVLDVTPPGPATVTVTPRTDNVESATWTVTPPEPGTTTECRLRYEGTVVRDWHACSAPYTYALTEGDGAYVLEVRVTDAVGNLGAVAIGQSYVVDMTPPLRPVVTSNRTVKDNERSVTYEFSGEGVATCQLTRDGAAVGSPVVGCTTGYTITLPDVSGSYVLVVTYEDAVGNVSDPGSSPAYELDVTPPVVPTVTSDRSGTDNERPVRYEFSGEGVATCQLTRNGVAVGAAVECTSPWVVTLPTVDGEYVLLVTYTDAVGNPSAPGASPAYVLDLTPPPAPVVLGPPPTGNARTVTWTYAGEGTATCQLRRDGAAYGVETACGATSFSTTLPSDGSWSLSVSFTDAVGNRGPPGTSAVYRLDTVAPTAPGITGPTGPSQGRSPSWTVTAETGTAVECRLLRAGAVVRDWTACAGSYGADLTGLPDGGYVVEARATDEAGNLGAVGTSAAYVLDSTAPVAPSVTGPSGPSQSRNPSFSWTGEPGTTAECLLALDGVTVGSWTACTSGHAPTLDRDGTWTLTVRLTDVAGNVGPPAASGGYVLDTTPPPAPFVTPPQSPGRDLAPSWGAVVEGGSSLECRLVAPDGTSSGWAACTLPHVTPLEGRPDGAYVLEVRATDAAGNLSPVGSGRYVLDTVAPAAAVVTSPASPGRSRTPSFSFTTEPGSTTRCRLTSGTTVISDYAPCTSPALVDLTGLPDGTYTLTVRVADAAGNPGPAATGTYVLDTTGPAAPVATLSPASPSADRTPTWAFSAEAGSTLLCRLTAPGGAVRDITPCTSALTLDLTGQPTGTWTLTVRAVDAAGNVGDALTLTYVLDPAAVSGPDVTGPVSPGSSRTPRWTISTATTTECRLTLGTTVLRDWAVCAGAFTADLFGKPDGTYVLSVRTRTATGTVSAATTSRYVLDTTAPAAATIVGPPTPSTNRLPTWSIASPELGATAECRVLLFGSVLRDWAPCAVSPAGSLYSGLNLDGRGDGTYTLVVRLTDAAGNRGPEATSAYVLDTSAPVGVGVTGPPSPGNDRTPTWTFSAPGTEALECRLTSVDGVVSDWDTCAGSYTADLTGLPDGTYTLAVRAVSAAGTPGPETTSAYVLSTEAPDGPTALVLVGTGSTGKDRSPTWTFTLPSGTTGRCVVVQGARTVYDGACSSPFTLDLSNAQDGSYTLTVTAIDVAGTASPGVSSTYVLDTVPTAAPVFTQVPGTPGSTLDPQWRFTVVYGATAECRLLYEGAPLGDWAPCTSPYTAVLTGRPDGRYVLEVRAVDAAGNSSPPKTSAYVLDRTALPIVTFTGTPETPGTDRTVSWSLSAPQGTQLECRLVAPDGTTAWADCAGTYRLGLSGRPDGDYVLEARVVVDGKAGSVSRATYTLDTRPPAAPSFSSVPPAAGNDPQPRWSWDATTDDRVECRLVRVGGGALTAWAPCTSPYEAQLTADGSYALEIRVVDAAGNTSPVTSRSYVYDTRAPSAPVLTTRPPASGTDRTVSWTFTVPPGAVATCTVTRGLSRVDERTCDGRYDLNLAGQPDGVYTLTVRFTDAAGNSSSPTTGRYTLATVGGGRPGRIDPPAAPTAPPTTGGPAPLAPTGPGRGGTGPGRIAVPQGSTSRPPVPILPTDTDVPRSTVDRTSTFTPSREREEAAAAPEPKPRETTRARNPLLADPLPVGDVPEVLREAVTSTITRPTLPLALLAIVILFLLAQNRIDRRDPKLASAPVEAEPELDFTTIVRRPGGALS